MFLSVPVEVNTKLFGKPYNINEYNRKLFIENIERLKQEAIEIPELKENIAKIIGYLIINN